MIEKGLHPKHIEWIHRIMKIRPNPASIQFDDTIAIGYNRWIPVTFTWDKGQDEFYGATYLIKAWVDENDDLPVTLIEEFTDFRY